MLAENCTFSSYRRAASGGAGNTTYSGSATITNGMGRIDALDGKLKATFGIDNSVESYMLMTEETNFERRDKLTITHHRPSGNVQADYYVEELEPYGSEAMALTRLILTKVEDVS